ncbi:1-deoxy-D-xylulose-5-phosphate reductoisomerase [Alphaproteobacteria bacterium]|nr:1-deoxy-D-xylulose-5-phosphate reductoisomerase [Alphaproteobacteria bacterium]
MRRISLFGATGTIGDNALSLVDLHPERFRVEVLSAHRNVEKLSALARKYNPSCLVIADAGQRDALKAALPDFKGDILAGEDGLIEAAQRPCDVNVMAIVGFAGLRPALAASQMGHILALANKECLVAAGPLLMAQARAAGTTILPIDSEHNAIFQLLDGRDTSGLEKMMLTASGGPFREATKAELENVTPAMAVAHPNWDMGAKISVDSATLMNKGLELIEAHYLFDVEPDKLDVLVHPQSVVHGLIGFADGSTLAQKGSPDMRTPLAHCMAYPERIHAGVPPLDLAAIGQLTFAKPDRELFPCLALAEAAMRAGGLAPTILNGANEEAVAAFLTGRIGFLQIGALVAEVMAQSIDADTATPTLEAVFEADILARKRADIWLENAKY